MSDHMRDGRVDGHSRGTRSAGTAPERRSIRSLRELDGVPIGPLHPASGVDGDGRRAAIGADLPGVDLHRLAASDGDLRTLLGSVVRLAVELVPHTAAASVMVGAPAGPDLLIASSSLAQAGDGLQFVVSAGPAFDAYRLGRPVRTDDLVDDERWASLRGSAAGADLIRSALAMPMTQGDAVAGVLTLYSDRPGAFDDGTADRLVPFAATAERLLRDHGRMAELRLATEQLEEALTSRAVIDQAKGMVMLAQGCGPDEAFDVLRRMSNGSNRKVRDVAADMIAEASRSR